MKKLLILVLIILLIIMVFFTISKGITIGDFQILSASQIGEKNAQLTTEIANAQELIKKQYPEKKEELSNSITDLLAKKEEYFKLAKLSSDKEITKANTEETYLIEFLWTRIGNHATSKGVNLAMNVDRSDAGENIKDLAITAKGYYVGIMDFVSSLENDDKLNFKIENFRLVKAEGNDNPQGDDNLLVATFNVKGVRIKIENVTATASNQQETQEQNNVEQPANTTDTTKLDQTTGVVDNILAP